MVGLKAASFGRMATKSQAIILQKVGLPSFIVAAGLFMRTKDRFVMVLVGAFALLSLLFGVLTGERVNLLTKIFAGLLVLLIYRRYFTNTVPLILLFGMLSSLLFLSNSDLFSRFFSSFYHTLPIFEESPYRKVYVAAINVFNQHPLLGIGPATYEQLCPQHVTQNVSFQYANRHPSSLLFTSFHRSWPLWRDNLFCFYVSLIAKTFKCFQPKHLLSSIP